MSQICNFNTFFATTIFCHDVYDFRLLWKCDKLQYIKDFIVSYIFLQSSISFNFLNISCQLVLRCRKIVPSMITFGNYLFLRQGRWGIKKIYLKYWYRFKSQRETTNKKLNRVSFFHSYFSPYILHKPIINICIYVYIYIYIYICCFN